MIQTKTLRWHLEVMALRHGLWAVAGVLLAAAALALWGWWVPAQEAELALARSAAASAAPAITKPGQAAPAARLPQPAEAADGVTQLFALAGAHGLRIAQADYRREETGQVGRWQVQVPVAGDYRQLRRFLRAAQAIPGLSVDEMGLHRGGSAAPVEARLLFSIWYASAPKVEVR